MKKRIFMAIEVPDEIKRELLSYEKKWDNLRIKWINFYKIHLSIEFLGEVDKNDLDSIIAATQETAATLKPFEVKLDRIVLGPNPAEAKMFWSTIRVETEMKELRKTLHMNLHTQNYNYEFGPFKPHITIARARGNQLKGKQTNVILKDLKFQVESINLIESQLRPNVEKIRLVKSFRLGE